MVWIALVAAAVAANPPAASWTDTFPPAAVASYLDADGRRVLVAGAGEKTEPLRAAAEAFATALRQSGRAKLVMDASPLGDVSQASDEQIVKKAQALPVELIAVVRVFPGGTDGKPSAVITLFDKAGQAVSAIAAELGTPVAPRAGASAGAGISSSTVQAVEEVGKGKAASPAQEQYDQRYIWFQDAAAITSTGAVVAVFGFAYEGKYKKPLGMEEFLVKVGKPELATQHRERLFLRGGLLIGGILGAAAGGALLPVALVNSCSKKDAQTRECLEQDWTPTIGASVLLGGGLVAIVAAYTVNPQVVDLPTMRKMADEYNQKLKGELGLTRREQERRRGLADLEIAVAPVIGPGGGGLALSVRF